MTNSVKQTSEATIANRTGLVADEKVLILDFGSQYAQLIARRVRELNVYCEIVRHDITAERVRELAPRGVILSGGPSSVYEAGAPKVDPEIFKLGIPVLGICYGLHLAWWPKRRVRRAELLLPPGATWDFPGARHEAAMNCGHWENLFARGCQCISSPTVREGLIANPSPPLRSGY